CPAPRGSALSAAAARRGARRVSRDDPGDVLAVGLAVVLVQRVMLELVLMDVAAAPDVERRDDLAGLVDLDAGGVGVGTGGVEERRERDDALVHVRAVGRGDDATEIALLNPKLGRACQLVQQERHEVRNGLARRSSSVEALGQVAGEHARVVAEAVHGGRAGARAALADAPRAL